MHTITLCYQYRSVMNGVTIPLQIGKQNIWDVRIWVFVCPLLYALVVQLSVRPQIFHISIGETDCTQVVVSLCCWQARGVVRTMILSPRWPMRLSLNTIVRRCDCILFNIIWCKILSFLLIIVVVCAKVGYSFGT